MQAIQSAGLSKYLINLMVMDYGPGSPNVCTMGANGRCDMGASAVSAARSLNSRWGVPLSQIELTPMIGGNDEPTNVFTLADAATVSSYVRANSLAGIHYWSLDRDRDCPPGSASETCNTLGNASTLGFTKAFLTGLGISAAGK